MRLRNVPGSREAIADNDMAINEPTELKGKWKEEFGNDNPIRIEIGMGKGKFITTLAMEIQTLTILELRNIQVYLLEQSKDVKRLKYLTLDL